MPSSIFQAQIGKFLSILCFNPIYPYAYKKKSVKTQISCQVWLKKLIKYKSFHIFHENISCYSQSLIYLLTCKNVSTWEKLYYLSSQENKYSPQAKSGCVHMIRHFRSDCAISFFVIQILEIFLGRGYKNNKVCSVERLKRLIREIYWMKSLRTFILTA